jgi:hypothetical protein
VKKITKNEKQRLDEIYVHLLRLRRRIEKRRRISKITFEEEDEPIHLIIEAQHLINDASKYYKNKTNRRNKP